MKDEQIQMVLNALLSMGAEGKEAFIWWLAMDRGLSVFSWLITFAGILWVGNRLITHFVDIRDVDTMLCHLRDTLGVGSPGPMLASEAKETIRLAVNLARKAKNEIT